MKISRSVIAFSVAAILCILIAIWISARDAGVAPRRRDVSEAKVVGPEVTSKPIRRSTENIDGYVTAAACRECHRQEHASWHASYHSRMTQAVTPETAIGAFDKTVQFGGRFYEMEIRDGTCWVTMDDPDGERGRSNRIERPISVSTGSHHMQAYWYAGGQSDRLGILPIIYLKETQQWVPRPSVFIQPHQGVNSEMGRWNETCILCHTTGPRHRDATTKSWDTSVIEFGISCEACHGPGEEHIAIRRDQATSDSDSQPLDDPIVNPARLPSQKQAQVCGQCHAISVPTENASNENYFRPGAELSDTLRLIRVSQESWDTAQRDDPAEHQRMRNSFWSDGMVRVAGREYNGLVESSCFQRGEMSCLSCHSLHQAEGDERPAEEWADDLLAIAMRGDHGCVQCHEGDRYAEQHTHHPPSSSGARCYNCHMPYTTYGLLKSIRSHTITSPDIAADLKAKRPNACNLCHVDKTLQWSADWTQQWFGAEPPQLADEQRDVAASLLWLLKGDAGERALAASSLGWESARQASGGDWQAPLLAQLLDDPYPAVRVIAARSLRADPKFADLKFNFVGVPAELSVVKEQVLQTWSVGPSRGANIFIDEDGLQAQAVEEIVSKRDDREVTLAE